MIFENDILLLDLEDWQTAGLSLRMYKNAKHRKQLVSHRAAKGRPVQIEFESITRQDFKDALNSHFDGDVYKAAENQILKQYLKPDQSAFEYYLNANLNDAHVDKYTTAAKWLNLANDIQSKELPKHITKRYKANQWSHFLSLIKTERISLPTSYSRFRKTMKAYGPERNYNALISGKIQNDNSRKITEEAGEWLIAQYSLPIKLNFEQLWVKYNVEAMLRGWKTLNSSSAIYQFLNIEENKRRWYGSRHGELKAKEKYGYTLRTQLPSFRDALWYGDGTKLNYFSKEGKLKAGLTVYEVVDVFSECLLGYHIGYSEDYVAQYNAYKMAVEFSQAQPYQIGYDNQGGHKKIKESFLDKLSFVGFPTQAYNGKSKTIESVFGRIQQQTMKQDWFFTGQNITARSLNSRANMEFVIKNMKHLPTEAEIREIYAERREEWNNGLHPKYKVPRKQLYMESQNPHHKPVGFLQMVELFWVEASKPIKYYTHGIKITIKGEDYEFEVQKDGMPDEEFRRKYIDARFVVKYDPANMTHIRLYKQDAKGNKTFVEVAEPRIVVPRAVVDYKEGDRAKIKELLDVRKREQKQMKDKAAETAEATGVSSEDLVTVGQYTKDLSNADDEDHWAALM